MWKQYMEWCHDLANEGFLDILSIGTSQLSQSNFGENWDRKINGGEELILEKDKENQYDNEAIKVMVPTIVRKVM